MSLINQMLRDLESRRAQAQGSKPGGALDNLQWPATPGLSGKAPGGLRAVNWLRLGGIVAVFAILLSAYLWYSRATPLNTTPETVVQASIPAVPPTAQPVTGGDVAEAAPATQQAPQASPEDEDRATPALAAQEAPAAAEPPATEEPPVPVIKRPSAEGLPQRAERGYQEAVEALQNGRIAEARRSLREVLAQQPLHHKSRELLTEIYLRSGEAGEAENLLAAGALQDPRYTLFSKLHARLLLQRGDISGALRVLERHLADAAGDAEYHALLGALYQRAGDHAQAVIAYRTALGLEPGQGVWWMGLAISLEAQQNPDAALHAYRRAQGSGALTGATLEFVQRKITHLETPAS